jgi:hypothetical protein
MKYCLGFLFFLFYLSNKIWAQKDSLEQVPLSQSVSAVHERAPKAVYLGLGGAGFLFSLNYDSRFSKRADKFGFAIGIGGFPGGSEAALMIPFSINYLVGKKEHFLELAGGATYTSGEIGISRSFPTGQFFFLHVNAGYRYQRSPKGFLFRGGFSPLYFPTKQSGSKLFPLVYLGAGIGF